MPVQTLIINSNHAVSGSGNSRFQFKFPTPQQFPKGSKIAVQSLTVPYSWYNVSAYYSNQTITLIIPYGAGLTATLNLTITAGFYTVSQINQYLQQQLINAGWYLVSGSSYWYPLQITTNTAYYSIEIDCFKVPTALGSYTYGTTSAGWGLSGLPTVGYTPQVQFATSGSIRGLLGFASGTFPSTQQTTAQSFLSTSTPNLTPVNSVILLCNLVNNKYAGDIRSFFSFSPVNTSFGSNIVINPNGSDKSFIDIYTSGFYNYLELVFADQNYGSMVLNDTNISIQVLISSPDE